MILAGQEDFEVVAEASNGREAVEKARDLRPDVVVMDISMPDVSGIDATTPILLSGAYLMARIFKGVLDTPVPDTDLVLRAGAWGSTQRSASATNGTWLAIRRVGGT
jgi:DNA-binding NarL/FixJ family response regulator